MEANPDKKLDDFLKKTIKSAGFEEPSVDFTASVMDQIQQKEGSKFATSYKPLISKNAWISLGLILMAVFAFLLSGEWESDFSNITLPFMERLSDLSLPDLSGKFNLNSIDNINIHPNVIYAVLMLSVFLYAQIIYLKRNIE
ncbi:MAG: hypothetical protein ACR2MM_10525 [Flavobacteriaceae bacterium]